MKAKFHLNMHKRSPHRQAANTAGTGPVTALVDERFLAWLASQVTGARHQTLQRAPLPAVMAHLARLAGAEASLLRTVLFTDVSPTELVDDIVVRLVPPHAQDGGLTLVRAMGQEMVQIAQHQAQGWLLVASDDERLIPYIDEAQWRGMRVALVADDAVHDYARLAADDPSWARLLLQADRRVAVPVSAWNALTVPGGRFDEQRAGAEDQLADPAGSAPLSNAEPDDEWRAQVSRVIQDWWEGEAAADRSALAEHMRGQQGVPPEADRRILMQVRRSLGRNLSFAEKRAMREMVRRTVLGDAEAAPADVATAAD
jgi:hypothetical protein